MLNKSSCKSCLGRHAQTLRAADSASSTHVVTKQDDHNPSGRSRIKYGMTLNLMGFTLIELLVVVLIIGILASIALPQYQKAVEKSKATQALTVLKSFYQASQAYYMANGTYPVSFDELSVDMPWTGSEAGIVMPEIKDTRSNTNWSLQLYNAGDGYGFYITRLNGLYQGAGFTVSMSGAGTISCTERKRNGTVFGLADGAFCEKIMKGTRFNGDGSWSYRQYSLP